MSAQRAVLDISGRGGVGVKPVRYTRSNPAQSAVRKNEPTLWRERKSQRRTEVFKIFRLHAESEGFYDLSDVFGDFFGHRCVDDDEEVSRLAAGSFSFPLHSELGSGLGVRGNFERKPLSVQRFERDFGSKQEIEERNGAGDGDVEGFWRGLGFRASRRMRGTGSGSEGRRAGKPPAGKKV